MGRHSQFFGFKRGCSMFRTSDQFIFFHRFCLCLISCFVCRHLTLKTPGDFFDLCNLLNQPKKVKSIYDTRKWLSALLRG